jgi:hypothetical protein
MQKSPHILLQIAIITMACSGCFRASAADQAPYWIENDDGFTGEKMIDSGKALIGRQFVFTASANKREPRYGRLTLFTFEESALHERRPMADLRYPIQYDGNIFRLPGVLSITDRTHQFLASYFGTLGSGTSPQPLLYRLSEITQRKGALALSLVKLENDRRFDHGKGFMFEVDQETAKSVLADITRAEQAEKDKRAAELAAAGEGPLPAIDLHDTINSDLVEDIYYGRFDRQGRQRSQMISDDDLIGLMFASYHDMFELDGYVKTCGEPTVNLKEIESSGMVDRYGFPVGSVSKRTLWEVVVRERFADLYRTANRARNSIVLDQIGALNADRRFQETPASVFTRYAKRSIFAPAMSAFLSRYYRTSPATVKRLEENLERYLRKGDPITMPRPALADYAAKAGWHPGGKEERGSAEGLRWVKPANWDRPAGLFPGVFANFYTGLPAISTVVLQITPRDAFTIEAYLEAARKSGRAADEPFVPAETFEVAGRTVHYLPLVEAVYALIPDGKRLFMVRLAGSPEGVAAARDEFRKFIQSFEWEPVDDAVIEAWLAERRPKNPAPRTQATVRGGRRTLAGAGPSVEKEQDTNPAASSPVIPKSENQTQVQPTTTPVQTAVEPDEAELTEAYQRHLSAINEHAKQAEKTMKTLSKLPGSRRSLRSAISGLISTEVKLVSFKKVSCSFLSNNTFRVNYVATLKQSASLDMTEKLMATSGKHTSALVTRSGTGWTWTEEN